MTVATYFGGHQMFDALGTQGLTNTYENSAIV